MIVTAFTPGYAESANLFACCCERAGVEYKIFPYKDQGWLKNVMYKPTAILQELQHHKGVWWVDVDCMVRSAPPEPEAHIAFYQADEPSAFIYDFATRQIVANEHHVHTPAGTVIYIACETLALRWQELCAQHEGLTNDEQCLRAALETMTLKVETWRRWPNWAGINSIGYNHGKPPRGGV
jgi:hypothetical protein